MDRLLSSFYVPAMNYSYRSVRVVPLVVSVILIGVAIQGVVFTSQLSPPLEEEVWFPENHMHTSLFTFARDNYFGVTTEDQAVMTLFWGVRGLDRTDFDQYRPLDSPGTPIYDSSFDLSAPEAQQAILNTCAALRVLPCSLEGCRAAANYGGTLALGSNNSVSCFLEDFGRWLGRRRAVAGLPGGDALPTGPQFFDDLKTFRSQERPTKSQREEGAADWEEQIGFVNGQLRYVSVKFRTAMPVLEPMGTGLDVQRLLYNFADEHRATSPSSAAGPRAACVLFTWFDTAAELISGLFSGCFISGPVAFLVLLIATHNIVIAFYAVTCVAAVVVCVLGFCKSAMGWSLGIGESVAGVIVIGLAVDYVVHLAHMYVEAGKYGHTTRTARAAFAIENMGVTVFAGAITTSGAALIMFACFSTFFHKMAILMSMTIFFSFLFSLGLFMSMLWLGGPEGDFGDLLVCFSALKRKARKR